MTSRTMHITNNYGESVRLKVTYRDNTTDEITLDDNNTQSLEIKGILFLEPEDCDVVVAVYKLYDDTSKVQKTIPPDKNDVNIFINKGDVNPVISVMSHTWNIEK